ncbi:MAG: beta strand repeat-containing protein, partial [Isosphaeraceae bacterium]
ASHDVTVTAYDPFGNVATGYTGTVALASSDGQAALPSSYAFTAADAGIHQFSVTLKTAGNQSITATDSASNLSGSEASIAVQAAAAHSLEVSGFPATDTAGTAASLTVTAYDPFGNVATGYSGTVALASSDGQAVLPASYTFAASDDGKHTFTVTLKTAGNQSITATDQTDNLTGSQSGIAVQAAAASSFQVSGFPTIDTAGASHDVTVTAYDPFGNVATGYTGTVALASSDGQAALPSSYAFTAADAGIHQFSVTLKTAGNQSITATDQASNLSGSEASIAVNAAAAAGFRVSGFPTPDTAGAVHGVTVTAVDPFGNTVSNFTGTVALTSSDGKAALPSSYTFAASDAGTHQFRLALDTAGTQSITATDPADSLTGAQGSIAVQAAAASSFQVSGFPSPDIAGASHNVAITVYDPFGNIVTDYTGTVKFASSDGQAALPPSYTFTAADAGVHQFSVTLKTAGTQSIIVSDHADGVNGSVTGIAVNAAAAAGFRVSGFPTPDTAGASHEVTVTAVDPFGNTVSNFTGTVTLASSDGQAVLPAGHTFTAGDAGTFRFSVILDTAGNQSITATDQADNLTGTQSGIAVSAAAASRLVFSQGPTDATAGTAIGPAVTVLVEDAYHNVVTSDGSTVTLTLDGGTFEGGSSTAGAAASDGIATFGGLKIDAAGRYTLTADDGSLAPTGPSDAFTVSPAAPARLVIATEPSATATAGLAFAVQPVIREFDAFGNLETIDSTTVVTASTAVGIGTLGGPVTATFTEGVARFQGLAADSAGTLAIAFTAGTLPTATSSAITVSPASPAKLVVTGPPPSALVAGQSFTVTVAAEDAFGNPVPSFTGEVTVSVPGDPGFTTTVAAHGGVATFTGLMLNTNASGQAIQVTSAGLRAAATSPMSVTPAPNPTPTGTGAGTGSSGSTGTSSPPATIVSERIVTMQKTNKKGKHVGKPRFVGFALQFSAAMNPATASLTANYQLEQTFKKRVKHRLEFVHRAIAVAASYDATTHTVTLTVQGKPKFAAGGQLTILASAPGGVADASGTLLAAADSQFLIRPKGKGITLG